MIAHAGSGGLWMPSFWTEDEEAEKWVTATSREVKAEPAEHGVRLLEGFFSCANWEKSLLGYAALTHMRIPHPSRDNSIQPYYAARHLTASVLQMDVISTIPATASRRSEGLRETDRVA